MKTLVLLFLVLGLEYCQSFVRKISLNRVVIGVVLSGLGVFLKRVKVCSRRSSIVQKQLKNAQVYAQAIF